jgi:hypothetical protein
MKPTIQVEPISNDEFRVSVTEGTTRSSHKVTLKPEYYQRLTDGKIEPQQLVRKSFEFLLEHEPKESILRSFNLTEIARYFPAFEGEIKKRVGRS